MTVRCSSASAVSACRRCRAPAGAEFRHRQGRDAARGRRRRRSSPTASWSARALEAADALAAGGVSVAGRQHGRRLRRSTWRRSVPPPKSAPSSRSKSIRVRGGLGGAVAEVVAGYRPCPIRILGFPGFMPTGSADICSRDIGLTARGIADGGSRGHRGAHAMNSRYVLAIDQGTTNTKAIADRRERAHRRPRAVPMPVVYPRPGWAEQSAAEIWRVTREAIDGCLAQLGEGARIAAMGISNQRETVLLWRPRDGRAHRSLRDLAVPPLRRTHRRAAHARNRGQGRCDHRPRPRSAVSCRQDRLAARRSPRCA